MHTRFTIDVDGRPHEIHDHSVTGHRIKELAHRHEGSVLRLDGDDRHHVRDDETVHVHDGERFVIEHAHHENHDEDGRGQKHAIVIEVDGKRYEAPKREMTGSQIKALAHKPPANSLYLIETHDGRPFRREIVDTETLRLHTGECFATQPPVGKTS